MNCERCQVNEAEYLVYTDTMNIKVCIFCAITAKEIGLKAEIFTRLRTNHQQILRAFEQKTADILDGDLSWPVFPNPPPKITT